MLAVGFDMLAAQMHHVVLAAQPRLELVPVVRTARHAGIADVLHGKERIRRGEIDHDPVLGAGTRGVRWQLAAGVAQRVRSAIDFARADVECGVADRDGASAPDACGPIARTPRIAAEPRSQRGERALRDRDNVRARCRRRNN